MAEYLAASWDRRSPRQWPLTGKFHDDTDRQLLAVLLFGCVTSALSAIECFFMATYGAAAAQGLPSFPIDDAKHLYQAPKDVTKCFERDRPGAPLTVLLRETIDSPEFKRLGVVRNVLSHRGTIPRLVNSDSPLVAVSSNPRALAADFNYNQALDATATEPPLQRSINRLSPAFLEFLS